MTGNWARAQARARIEAIGAASTDDRTLRRQVLTVLREVVVFDAYVWLLTDPVTAVGAAPLADVPCMADLPALIKAKYATSVNRWTHFAAGRPLSRSCTAPCTVTWDEAVCGSMC